jgi:L-fucose mutarotase/ribose pyranase (RbsD/FucU family)
VETGCRGGQGSPRAVAPKKKKKICIINNKDYYKKLEKAYALLIEISKKAVGFIIVIINIFI